MARPSIGLWCNAPIPLDRRKCSARISPPQVVVVWSGYSRLWGAQSSRSRWRQRASVVRQWGVSRLGAKARQGTLPVRPMDQLSGRQNLASLPAEVGPQAGGQLSFTDFRQGPSGSCQSQIAMSNQCTFSTGGIAQVPSIAALRGEYSRAWRENGWAGVGSQFASLSAPGFSLWR